jgi:uncharacterized repeat protein (TIGR01451 family)
MKFRVLNWFFRIVLLLGMLVIPSFNSSAAAPAAPAQVPSQAPGADPLKLISIPATPKPPTADGYCDPAEYDSGISYTFNDGGGANNATVWLMHDADYLYVCMSALHGSYSDRFASLYLDPQGDGSSYQFARDNDYSLKITIDSGVLSSWQGSGVGPSPASYIPDGTIDPSWSALSSSPNNDLAEYKILLKGFDLNACGGIFGLAVYHHWFSFTGNDYGWPSNQWYDQPRTWQLATLEGIPCNASGKIAYVFRGDTLSATSFYNLLAGAGYTVTLIPLSNVLSYDFTTFDLTIIADDTGSLNTWGSGGTITTDQVNQITAVIPTKPGGTPILGLGEGGYAFYGKLGLFIGWPHGWHGPQDHVRRGSDPVATSVFNTIGVDPVPYYASPTNSVGIYLLAKPANVYTAGLEDPLNDHASIITQDCRMLWGNSGNPLSFDTGGNGQTMFLNAVGYMRSYQCPTPIPPPTNCTLSITKSDNLPVGDHVNIGDTIIYKINYALGDPASNCPTGKVVDVIPAGTTFVPGSATGGVTPAADGTLTWSVSNSGSLYFSVIVTETACATGLDITNSADLRVSAGPILTSDPVIHPVTCQVVSLPNDQPMYAESEFKIDPYPLISGNTTHLSVRVRNLTASPQPVSVQFQSSPAVFGIGLDYSNPLGSASAIVPASGYADVGIDFVPVISGIACIQAVVTADNGSGPLITQSCLDVTEVLQPGVTATLSFPVRNNTGSTGDVLLVVDNTCPGWSATITSPASGTYAGLAVGATGDPLAVLSVTPPSSGLLGSGCHIDVQAWKDGQMIGGIRKVDIAPVHLPLFVRPPWEEPEITFIPNPPVLGVPGQICIRLVNPLPTHQTVTVDFSVADFGAGVGFTPASINNTFILPPNSITSHCVSWTPTSSGTLHRCILATLKQAGYLDQTSQSNIDVVRASSSLSGLTIPFMVGNPDLVGHTLTIVPTLVGIDPLWMPIIEPLGGVGAVPGSLAGGERLALQMRFGTAKRAFGSNGLNYTPPLLDLSAGERHSVEVTVLLDGVPTGGFTVQLEPVRLYLPAISQ